MTDAHYEAVRLAALRPQTTGGTRKCLLPFRLWPKPKPPAVKVSYRFSHPEDGLVQSVTHRHILRIGDRILEQIENDQEQRFQQACEELVETERQRIDREYNEKTNAAIRKWKSQLEEERRNLQKEFDEYSQRTEQMRLDQSRIEQEKLTRKMKDECNQALARQWQLAQEQMNLAVRQAEDKLRQSLELKHSHDKQNYGRQIIEQKEVEYTDRETKALELLKIKLEEKHQVNLNTMKTQHQQQIEEINDKLRLAEERFRREFSARARLESDFRLLQTDYKRFMDHSNVFHSDYMLKLCYIGEQIGDPKFEQVLDRILTETNFSKENEKRFRK